MKVGIVGAGLQGRRRAQALQRAADARLAVVADNLPEKAKSLAEEMGCQATARWEEVVARDDLDIVIVCTPPHLHAGITLAAVERGKHVLCEKPLALNPPEARQMVEAARASGVKLKCGFNLRHHPGLLQAREWFDRGVIGEPLFLRCRYGIGGRPGYEKEWRAKAEFSGGGQLMDQGMHVLDLCRWFLGELQEAFGWLSTGYWDIAPLEDNAFAMLRTSQGQVASLHVSWTQWKNLFSWELFGREGYIIVEGLGGSYGTERAILGRRAFLEPFREEITEFRGDDRSWEEEWREFLAAIRQDREPLGNGLDGLKALELAHAIYESARRGCVIKLESRA